MTTKQTESELKPRKINELLTQMKQKKVETEGLINALNETLYLPDVEPFNEDEANRKIAKAMIDDTLTGKKSAAEMSTDMEVKRADIKAREKARMAEKTKAKAEIETQTVFLKTLDDHIKEITIALDDEIKQIALDRLEAAKLEYVQACEIMFEKVVAIFGISSIFGENSKYEFTNMNIEIPSAGVNFQKYFGYHPGSPVALSYDHSTHLEAYRTAFLTNLLG